MFTILQPTTTRPPRAWIQPPKLRRSECLRPRLHQKVNETHEDVLILWSVTQCLLTGREMFLDWVFFLLFSKSCRLKGKAASNSVIRTLIHNVAWDFRRIFSVMSDRMCFLGNPRQQERMGVFRQFIFAVQISVWGGSPPTWLFYPFSFTPYAVL